MRINNITINNYKNIKNLSISFKNSELTIICGENGTGKTTILDSIMLFFQKFLSSNFKIKDFKGDIEADIDLNESEINWLNEIRKTVGSNFYHNFENLTIDYFFSHLEETNTLKQELLPKLIYLPAEIIFDVKDSKIDNLLHKKYTFLTIINSNFAKQIESFIVSKYNFIIQQDENRTLKDSKKIIINYVNETFKILDMDVKLVDFDSKSLKPIFKSKYNEFFNINSLSSGEKQLFFRILLLKILEPNNSIILIDEPELSLHPLWQLKIIEIFKKIGKNNQIIISTHSPYIIGSVSKKDLIILKKTANKIEFVDVNNLNETKGMEVNDILAEIMGIENTRDIETQEKIEKIKGMIADNKFNSLDFKNLYNSLAEQLGDLDKEIILINLLLSQAQKCKK